MPELLEQALAVIVPSLASLIAVWFTVLGTKLKETYTEKINTQVKRDVVDTTVAYIQQLYKDLSGEEKLNKAIERATLLLVEKNIPISEVELRMLIEAAVYGIKQGVLEFELPEVSEEQLKEIANSGTVIEMGKE